MPSFDLSYIRHDPALDHLLHDDLEHVRSINAPVRVVWHNGYFYPIDASSNPVRVNVQLVDGKVVGAYFG